MTNFYFNGVRVEYLDQPIIPSTGTKVTFANASYSINRVEINLDSPRKDIEVYLDRE